jgi:hypothetical protein
MWFILAFGLVACGGAAYFSFTAKQELLRFVYGMMLATGLAVIAGTAADIGATCANVSGRATFEPLMLIAGIGESMSPGILGCALLAIAAMFTAVGVRRRDARLALETGLGSSAART